MEHLVAAQYTRVQLFLFGITAEFTGNICMFDVEAFLSHVRGNSSGVIFGFTCKNRVSANLFS